MEKAKVNSLFDDRTTGKGTYIPKRTYDVRITLNKNGHEDGFSVRFGFLNKASKVFSQMPYIQVSNVEKSQDAIYFRSHNAKNFLDVYKLSSNSKSQASNCYTAFKPSAAQEKIYRLKWINKTFSLKYDESCGLYYIELKED